MSFKDTIKDLFDGVKSATSNIADTAKVRMEISKQKELLHATYLELGKLTYEKVKSGRITDERAVSLTDEIDRIRELVEEKSEDFNQKKENLIQGGKEVLSTAGEKISEVTSQAKDYVVEKAGEIKEKVNEKKEDAKVVVEEVKENISEKVEEAKDKASELKDKAEEKVQEAKEKVEEKVEEVKKEVQE